MFLSFPQKASFFCLLYFWLKQRSSNQQLNLNLKVNIEFYLPVSPFQESRTGKSPPPPPSHPLFKARNCQVSLSVLIPSCLSPIRTNLHIAKATLPAHLSVACAPHPRGQSLGVLHRLPLPLPASLTCLPQLLLAR